MMANFLQIVTRSLNPQQQLAVLEKARPVLVLSGAGTGKTRTIAYKVAYLVLEEGYALHRILALTFTNKAAREMRERILSLVQEYDPSISFSERQLYIGTFHSICAKILRWHGKLLGYTPDFSIFDEDDQSALIKKLVKEKGFQYAPGFKEVLRRISFWKNDFMSPEEVSTLSCQENPKALEEMVELYKTYQETLKQSNAMDFDDIQLNVIFLFQRNPDIQEFWRKQFQAVLVDEFQDTNKVQYLLLRMLLTQTGEHATFVGDDDQSIYSFRGAYIGNILNLSSDYPSLSIVKLEENYRSSSEILRLANHSIAANKNRLGKELFAHHNEESILPTLFLAQDDEQEVQFCLKALESKDPSETAAIIYRTNRQSTIFERELVKRGIPYTLLGGRKFYQKKEIRDIVGYLRLFWNPYDQAAFSRIINVPARGIGEVSRERLLSIIQQENLAIPDILKDPPKNLRLSQRSREEILQLSKVLEDLKEVVLERPKELLRILLGGIEYESYIKEYDGDAAKSEERLLNLQELEKSYERFLDSDGTPQEFLEMLSLADSSDTQRQSQRDGNEPLVVLTSVHGCKGLEFDWVFVVGLVNEIFPHYLSIETQEQLEEERRLFYVAVTRAKRRLFLTVPRYMFLRGRAEVFSMSQFVEELPDTLTVQEQGEQSTSSIKRWYEDLL